MASSRFLELLSMGCFCTVSAPCAAKELARPCGITCFGLRTSGAAAMLYAVRICIDTAMQSADWMHRASEVTECY